MGEDRIGHLTRVLGARQTLAGEGSEATGDCRLPGIGSGGLEPNQGLGTGQCRPSFPVDCLTSFGLDRLCDHIRASSETDRRPAGRVGHHLGQILRRTDEHRAQRGLRLINAAPSGNCVGRAGQENRQPKGAQQCGTDDTHPATSVRAHWLDDTAPDGVGSSPLVGQRRSPPEAGQPFRSSEATSSDPVRTRSPELPSSRKRLGPSPRHQRTSGHGRFG